MKCYDCVHNMKVVLATIRRNVDKRTAPRSEIYERVCLQYPNIFSTLRASVKNNQEPMIVQGTDDILIKHCTKYEQTSVKEGSASIAHGQLAHEIGSSHVDPASTASIQWERILNLLNVNGFTIVRRDKDG